MGPDLTSNGRNDFAQLLSNVFDPSLVIGAAYQATTVATKDGRVLTGLVAEDGPQRLVLKMQGGKVETIARGDVEETKVSPVSLMPDEIEKQLTDREWIDLFSFLTLDRPPGDPSGKRLPTSSILEPRDTADPAGFAAILDEFAPGFVVKAVGEGGLAIEKEHAGRPGVLRTHPVSREEPCTIRGKVPVPPGVPTRLVLDVSPDDQGDWQLVVKADGKTLKDMIVNQKSADHGWAEIAVDLSPFAGRTIDLEIQNKANDWSWEFGYWGRIAVLSGP